MDIVTRAREFAIQYHGDQKYGDKPYVYHLDMVYKNLDNTCLDWCRCAAYLHDVLEDTDCEYEDLYNNFGMFVADAVLRLTKCSLYSYEEYIDSIKKDAIAHAVKIADTRANLTQSVLDDNKSRIVKYAKQLVLLES